MQEFIISSESELASLSKKIIKLLQHQIVLLDGEMGAGKTTFVKYFIDAMTGYQGVNSPTFSIINEYENSDGMPIYHMDLYRLENIEEALNIGIEEYLDSGHLCLIEWPNLISNIIPETHHIISLHVLENGDRLLKINNL